MDETLTPGEDSTAAAPNASSGRPRSARSRHNSWIPRPAHVAITFVLLLTIGWGAFRIIDRPSQLDEETELADLQNFNDEPLSLGAPVNATSQFERSPLATNLNPEATSGAWLIGTIEADNVPERIALPPRVSQNVAEGPRFR